MLRRLTENNIPDWAGCSFVFKARQPARLVDYVTVDATQKTDEKTSKTVFHLTEIA